jgi:molecular chaperone DnaJ
VPPSSKSGKTLRVRGRGVPASSGVGDLLVTVEVAVPDRLSDETRKSVEALGTLIDGEALRAKLWGDR